MSLFGSSGIRGIVNKKMTPELALRAGKALGASCKKVVVGHDPRTSGMMVENALIAGLQASGADVVRIGTVSTPTLAYAARDYDCGVVVTASHNPAEYNGLKFWNPDGMAFSMAQQDALERLIVDGVEGVSWDKVGGETARQDAIVSHAAAILKMTGNVSLKVVLDCGCGAGSTITPYVLRMMGCHVTTLNAQPDGFFPAREPEPVDENLSALKKAVVSLGADVGIAHDGDADRMMAVDDKGRLVTGDELLAYFSMAEVKSSMACPVDASMMVERSIGSAKIYRTRIGDAFVSEEVKSKGADFGGEASGTWIFPRMSYCPDGIYAAARLVRLVSERGSLSKSIAGMPRYPLKRGSIKLEPGVDRERVMGMIMQGARDENAISLNTLDGVRVEYRDGWVLIRPSGTEPRIRITAEAADTGSVERLYVIAESTVSRCVSLCRQ